MHPSTASERPTRQCAHVHAQAEQRQFVEGMGQRTAAAGATYTPHITSDKALKGKNTWLLFDYIIASSCEE